MSKRFDVSSFFKDKSYVFWFFLATLLVLFILTVSRVGTTTLWGDEGFRAMIGQSTLKTGYPSHWDGTQYTVGVSEDALSKFFPGKYIEVSSWFQYYILAFSYALFGMSTFTTRLPFWVAGFLIFVVLYRYRYLFSKPDKVFTISSILLLFNVTFLIYVLQANYYIYALLFTLLSTLLFFDTLRYKNKLPVLNLVYLLIVNQLLAHDHIPSALSVFIVQSGFLFFNVIKRPWKEKIKVGIYLLLSSVLLYVAVRLYSSSESLTDPGKYFWTSIVVFINALNFYIYPLIAFVLLLFAVYKYRSQITGKKWLFYTFLVTLTNILIISYNNFGAAMPFRYISGPLVLWLVAVAIIVCSVPKTWAIILFSFAIIPNFFSGFSKIYSSVLLPNSLREMVKRDVPTIPVITDDPIRCYYCEFLGEIFDPYPHPLENIVHALNYMNVKNRKIIVGPCEGNTIMFGTKGIIIDQMPPQLYKEVYKKPYELQDAQVIVNNSFCPWQADHEKIVAMGYTFAVIRLSQNSFIHDGELNVRSKFRFPQEPIAVIYYK